MQVYTIPVHRQRKRCQCRHGGKGGGKAAAGNNDEVTAADQNGPSHCFMSSASSPSSLPTALPSRRRRRRRRGNHWRIVPRPRRRRWYGERRARVRRNETGCPNVRIKYFQVCVRKGVAIVRVALTYRGIFAATPAIFPRSSECWRYQEASTTQRLKFPVHQVRHTGCEVCFKVRCKVSAGCVHLKNAVRSKNILPALI